MKPLHSHSLLLAWRVAEAEAKRLNAPELEPIHFLIGLCKTVSMDLPTVISKDAPDRDEILEELLREVRRLRTIFRTAQVNPTGLRRKLRGTPLDGRFQMRDHESLHRTPAAKKVFADAEHFAQLAGGIVYPAHLLYAVLLGSDPRRDETFQELGIDKPRLLEVTKREVVLQREDDPGATAKNKTRWN